MSAPDSATPWLRLVGIGADGTASLSEAARAAIEGARCVYGAPRQLALVRSLIRGQAVSWPSPLAEAYPGLLARRGQPTCVLASGDPFWFGIGATLAPMLEPGELVCYPSPSSLSLAASRLGWALQDVDVVSLHGRALHQVVRYLQHGRRVLALSWDARTPPELAALLVARGFGGSILHVLENLGAPDERVRSVPADAYRLDEVAALNLVALELHASPEARVIPTRGSLPDDWFEHDGQLTKQDVRALTSSALAPCAGELLWDIGAGSGSIAIEWLLAHPANRAIAVERDATRAARIRRNAEALGTPSLEVHEGSAPAALAQLPPPDAVFIGGGGARVFEACWQALRPGGRLVLNGVSLETEAELIRLHRAHGGSLRRLSVELAEPLGSMTGFKPQRAIIQWRVVKPLRDFGR